MLKHALALWFGLRVAFALPAAPETVPQFVIDYAPLVFLHSADPYKPSDISSQVANTDPRVNYEIVGGVPSPLTLDNLDQLNSLGGENIYLTAKEDVTTNPKWLEGVSPDESGNTNGATTAAVIVNDKGGGIVDAFYMYFYANNWGGKVLNFLNLGNHVGDWEHNMIRFKDGKPTHVWYSQHSDGQAFVYSVLEKTDLRPHVYSANGSHANYAIGGEHDHTIPNLNLPFRLFLVDYTEKGPVWDPLLSAYYYKFNAADATFTPYDDKYPVSWLSFVGKWGDEAYPNSDPRQKDFFGQKKYSGGPSGPRDKELNRSDICPDSIDLCIKREILGP